MVTKVNDTEFAEALGTHNKVVVKYYADWCGSCRLMAPKYNTLADKEEFKDVYFLDVNAEENPNARKMGGVSNLPFFAAFKDGQLVEGFPSAKPEAVEELVRKL